MYPLLFYRSCYIYNFKITGTQFRNAKSQACNFFIGHYFFQHIIGHYFLFVYIVKKKANILNFN